MTRETPFAKGRQAFYMYEANCPYRAGSDAAEDWLLGYDEAAEYWAADAPSRPRRIARMREAAEKSSTMKAGPRDGR